MHHIITFIAIFYVIFSSANGATVRFPVFNSIKIFSEQPPGTRESIRSPITNNYWCALTAVMTNNLYDQLQSLHVESNCYGKYKGGYVYHLHIDTAFNTVLSVLQNSGIFVALEPVNTQDKVEEAVWTQRAISLHDSLNQTVRAVIMFWHDLAPEEIVMLTAGLVDSLIYTDSPAKYFFVDAIATNSNLCALAQHDEIKSITLWKPKELITYYARELTNVNKVQKDYFQPVENPSTDWMVDVPYTGDSIWFGNGETNSNGYKHIDFFEYDPVTGDTILRENSADKSTWESPQFTFTYHGLMTAATAVGNGWASIHSSNYPTTEFLKWRGVAPKAMILTQDYTADVNNRSFTEGECYYTGISSTADKLTSKHMAGSDTYNNIIVTGPGNNGVKNQYYSQKGYYSVTACSKNTINAGAVEKMGPEIVKAEFSGIGPTPDGRIKPDVMTPGTRFDRIWWHFEIDSIAIVNSGTVKYVWHFGDGEPTWGIHEEAYRIHYREHSNGTLKFVSSNMGCLFSDSLTTPIISHPKDTLVIRWRIQHDNHPSSPSGFNVYVLWKRPQDDYAKKVNGLFYSSYFYVKNNNSMHDLRIPIGDTTVIAYENGPWGTPEEEVVSIRFGFHDSTAGLTVCKDDITNTQNEYRAANGCSISSPFCAGIACLMLQKYRDDVLRPFNISVGKDSLNIHDNPIWNSTARGILIHTAVDMVDTIGISGFEYNPEFYDKGDTSKVIYGVGPDWATGWGFVDAQKALEYVDTTRFREKTVSNDDSVSCFFFVPRQTDSCRVTLCWDDPENPNYDTNATFEQKLINDLDLYLRHVATQNRALPWVLDHSWMSSGSMPSDGIDRNVTRQGIIDNPAYKGKDTLNNVEVVDMKYPESGLWQIVVKGSAIAQDQNPKLSGLNQDLSLIFDFPLIDDTSKTRWTVDAKGHGDFLTIEAALQFLEHRDGDTVVVNSGDYVIESPVSVSADNIILQLSPGAHISFEADDCYLYFSSGTSRIIGAEDITLDPQIILYNTPLPREPLADDPIIGLFAEVGYALDKSQTGQTIVIGTGIFETFAHVVGEGLIGVLDPSDPTNPEKNTIIQLGFKRGDLPQTENVRSSGKLLMKNIRFEVNDEREWSNNDVAGIWGGGEIVVENCIFENIDADGVIKTTMYNIGSPVEPVSESMLLEFNNCTFSGFDNAIYAWACTTVSMSPHFRHTVFNNNNTDILFRQGAEGFCEIEANRINSIQIGSDRYETEDAIQALIDSVCTHPPQFRSNIIISDPRFVDPLNSDFRLAPNSPLIDAGVEYEDIGPYNTDLIYRFSRFLDIAVFFDSNDTVVVKEGVITKNTLSDIITLNSKWTTNLRPIYELTVHKNFCNNPSFMSVAVNDPEAADIKVAADYAVLEVFFNGVRCASLPYENIPEYGSSIYVDVVPDNRAPADVRITAVIQKYYGVLVCWEANAEADLCRYKVYRYPVGMPQEAQQIASVDEYTTAYVDTGAYTSYFSYAVVAYDYTGNQSYSVVSPLFPLRVKIKDYFYSYNYKALPLLQITNMSESRILDGYKIRLWFSREERPQRPFCLYQYATCPYDITMKLQYHPVDSRIAYVDIDVPERYALLPGQSSDPYNTAFKIYYSGLVSMDKCNDWSLRDAWWYWMKTAHVAVYDKNGTLIYGKEFLPDGAHNHPPTGISLSSVTVHEHEPVGTTVGVFTAVDVDCNDTHAFSLTSGTGDDDNSSFFIENNVLKTNAVFDYDEKNTYTIRVKTTDSFGAKYEKQFTVRIKEELECTPGDGTAKECAYPLDGANCEEVTLDLTGKGEYWLYAETWPGSDNPWWNPDIKLYLYHANVIMPPMIIMVNNYSYYYPGGWYTALDIPDRGPYLIRIVSQGGPFKLKFGY